MSSSEHRSVVAKDVATGAELPMPWPVAVGMHLLPGVALLAFFTLTAPLLHGAGLPPVWGLLVGTLVVLAPIELSIVVWARRDVAGSWWRRLGLLRLKLADVPWVVLTTLAGALAPGLVVWAEPALRRTVFGWLPAWYDVGLAGLSSSPAWVTTTTLILWAVSAVVVGPMVEEVYFRGWLLPHLPGGLVQATLVESGLFAVYHLWQPYTVVTVFVFTLPLAFLVRLRGNPTLSVLAHSTVNLLVLAALLLGAMDR